MSPLKAPWPYFGGKSRVAETVWRAFGDVPNFVEPFCGSAAVLLARPSEPKIETINDADCAAANDRERGQGRESAVPDLGTAGQGLHRKIPHLGNAGRGVNRQLPHLGNAGPITDWLLALAARMRRVRVACGDWTRVLGDSVTWRHGVTGVFLDPPCDDGAVDYSANRLGNRGARVHTTQKPLPLAIQLVEDFTDPDDVILDPFCGFATFGVAAIRLGRRYIGIELKGEGTTENYAEASRERLRAEDELSTHQARRAGQGVLFGGTK